MTWMPVYYTRNILSWVDYLSNLSKKETLLTYCMSLHIYAHCLKFLINESMMKTICFISSHQASGKILYEVDTCL